MPARQGLALILFLLLLMGASYYDIKTRTIPDWLYISGGIYLALNFSFRALLGPLAALPLLVAALLAPQKMGGGDIKFTACSSLFLGFSKALTGIVIGLLLVILNAALARAFNKKSDQGERIDAFPLAPYLSFGFTMMYLLGMGG